MSKQITELYKSRNILLEQLELQGYDVKEFIGCSLQEINIMFDKDQLDMLIQKKNASVKGKKVLVKYLPNDFKQLTTKILNTCTEDFLDDDEDDDDDESARKYALTKDDAMLIISTHEINESLTKKLKELWEMHRYYITIVNLDRLQYNVLNHTLVPKHTVIREPTRLDEIKTKYHITDDDQFPTISRFDPVAQAIGMRPGDMCEIIRPSKTAITTLYYRVCVNL